MEDSPQGGPPGVTLITGASGFIGQHVLRRLVRSDGEVHALSRYRREAEAGRVRWWQVDLIDREETCAALESIAPDTVLHLAGEGTGAPRIELVRPMLETNLLGTASLLEAAAQTGCGRVVMAGTMVEPDDVRMAPSSPYAASKSAASAYGRMFHAIFELAVVNLRLFMVYGPGQRDLTKLVPSVIASVLRGEPPKLSSGRLEFDWLYVEDAAAALVAAARADDVAGETIEIGTGELVSNRELVESLMKVLGSDLQPDFEALESRPVLPGRAADTRAAAALLGWRPRFSLEEGLGLAVDWYRGTLARELDPR